MELATLYQEEIEGRISALRSKIGDKGADDELRGISQTVSLLEAEGRSQRNPSRREAILMTAAGMRRELDTLQEDARRRALLQASTRRMDEAKVGGRGAAQIAPDLEEEDDEEIVKRSSNNLRAAKLRAVEIQEIASGITSDLSEQAETINRATGKIDTTNQLTSKARNVLRGIEKSEMRNTAILWGAVIFVIVAMTVAFYVIFF